MQGTTEAAALPARHPSLQLAAGDVGEYVGVPSEGDDRPGPVSIGRQHVDGAVGRREPADGCLVEDRRQWVRRDHGATLRGQVRRRTEQPWRTRPPLAWGHERHDGRQRDVPPRLPGLVRMAGHGDRRCRRQAPRQSRPSLQPGRAVPEGQPLARPRLQPAAPAHAAAPHRTERLRDVRADDLGRRLDDDRRRTASGDRHPRRRGGAALQQRRQPEPVVGDGPRRPVLPPPRGDPARARPVWTDGRRRGLDDERDRTHPRSDGVAPQQVDHPLGHEHAAHQPPPVADHRGRPRRRRQARRHRPAAHDHRRRRRRVRPTTARDRRRPDAGDDPRADPRPPDRRPVDRRPHARIRRAGRPRRRVDAPTRRNRVRARGVADRAAGRRLRDDSPGGDPHPDRRRAPPQRGDVPPHAGRAPRPRRRLAASRRWPVAQRRHVPRRDHRRQGADPTRPPRRSSARAG